MFSVNRFVHYSLCRKPLFLINKHSFQCHLQYFTSLLQLSHSQNELFKGQSLHSVLIKTGLDQDVYVQNNILRMYADCGDLNKACRLFDEIPQPNLVSYTSMISSCVQQGCVDQGLNLFVHMNRSGVKPNEFGFSSAIKACRIRGDLTMGKLVHGCIIKCGYESYVFCTTAILDMYVKCGSIDDGHRFFEGVISKCEVLWNTLIDGYSQNYDACTAVDLFHQMLLRDISASPYTYTILMKLCIDDFDMGRFLHGRVLKVGFESHSFVGGALVGIYAKWAYLTDAFEVFRCLEERDNVVWSTLLNGYCQSGDAERGLELYREFVSKGNKLDPFMLASLFHLCKDLETPEQGLQMHSCMLKSGFVLDSFIGNAIVSVYVNFGLIADAWRSFMEVRDKNEICFSTMISGFSLTSDYFGAIKLFLEMMNIGLMASCSTLHYVLEAYSNLDLFEGGKTIHSYIVKSIGGCNLHSGNALIDMYAKCGQIDEAHKMFEEIDMPNEYSWTTMINGYVESMRCGEALELFHDMNSLSSIKPSQFTFVAVLQACSRHKALDQGRQTHGYIVKSGFETHVFIGSALIDMYAKNGDINGASIVFSNMHTWDLVTWSSVVTAFAQHGHSEEALKLFKEFQDGWVSIDESMWSSCLSACTSLVALEVGNQIHAGIIKTGFESHLHVGSGIIDMYCKCGSIEDACKFFNKARERNVVSWTAMVCGYAQHGLGKQALDLFGRMKDACVEPDGVTFIGVLSACSHVGLVKEGWHYFLSMTKDYGLNVTESHYACMVDLLGRAGHLEEAEALIKGAPLQSKTSLWHTLLGACNKHGNLKVGNRIAKLLINVEPNEPSNYVLLSNMYASASMWDHHTEVRDAMRESSLNKDPGCSWIEVST